MAADRANYFKLGLAFAAGIAAIVATAIYLGGAGGEKDLLVAETYYLNPVSGLSVGSSVNFRGVKVGEVKDITFVGSEYREAKDGYEQAILVRLGLDTRKFRLPETHEGPDRVLRDLVKAGLRATVSASGVTGLSRIELDLPKAGAAPAAPERLSWKPAHICIPPGLSLLDAASDSASRILEEVDAMDLTRGWTNVLRITEATAQVMERLRDLPLDTLTTNLVRATDSGAAVMGNLESIDFRGRVDDVSTNALAAIAASRDLVRSADAMVKSADRLVRDADALLVEQRGALRRVLANFEAASLQAKLLVGDLRAHPGRLLESADPAPLAETEPEETCK